MKTRTEVTDLLRDLNSITARKADAWLLPERVDGRTAPFRAQLYFTSDGQLVAAKPARRVVSSQLARVGVIAFFVLLAAACGALLG